MITFCWGSFYIVLLFLCFQRGTTFSGQSEATTRRPTNSDHVELGRHAQWLPAAWVSLQPQSDPRRSRHWTVVACFAWISRLPTHKFDDGGQPAFSGHEQDAGLYSRSGYGGRGLMTWKKPGSWGSALEQRTSESRDWQKTERVRQSLKEVA